MRSQKTIPSRWCILALIFFVVTSSHAIKYEKHDNHSKTKTQKGSCKLEGSNKKRWSCQIESGIPDYEMENQNFPLPPFSAPYSPVLLRGENVPAGTITKITGGTQSLCMQFQNHYTASRFEEELKLYVPTGSTAENSCGSEFDNYVWRVFSGDLFPSGMATPCNEGISVANTVERKIPKCSEKPPAEEEFVLAIPTVITTITVAHGRANLGCEPINDPKISIENVATKEVFGPYYTTPLPPPEISKPYISEVRKAIISKREPFPAGTYRVINSEPGSWVYASGPGFTDIWGIPAETLLPWYAKCGDVKLTNSCVTISGCVDGSDGWKIENFQITHTHYNFDQIGAHSDCGGPGAGYYIDGKRYSPSQSHPFKFKNITSTKNFSGRGGFSTSGNSFVFDDNKPGGASGYSVTVCGDAASF